MIVDAIGINSQIVTGETHTKTNLLGGSPATPLPGASMESMRSAGRHRTCRINPSPFHRSLICASGTILPQSICCLCGSSIQRLSISSGNLFFRSLSCPDECTIRRSVYMLCAAGEARYCSEGGSMIKRVVIALGIGLLIGSAMGSWAAISQPHMITALEALKKTKVEL